MELIVAPSYMKGGILRRRVSELLRGGVGVALVSFEGSTIRVLRDSIGKESNLLVIDATLSDGLEPLLLLAHVLGKYSGVIDEIYGPYVLFSSISNEAGSVRRKFIILINILRFLEDQTASQVIAFTSSKERWLMGLFDDITVIGESI